VHHGVWCGGVCVCVCVTCGSRSVVCGCECDLCFVESGN
jgi:hypothetical protein